MNTQAREIQYFLNSQSLADGFRTAVAVLLPALIGYNFNFFEIGITLSLGAMCVSLTDAPGPLVHRKNAMIITTGLVFIVAAITSVARWNVFTMGLEIAFVAFFFSMFNVYGGRAASVGNAVMLMMILTMDTPIDTSQLLPHALLILAGGVFYTIFSLLLHTLRPYRIAQRALADCIKEIGDYLSIKASFYDVQSDLDANYRKLVAEQVVVNEKQDAARELFFKTRQIVRESTMQGRRIVFTFVETVDLFEDITASYYDYELLRKQFASTGALALVHGSLLKITNELYRISMAMQANTSFKPGFDYDQEVRRVKAEIDRIAPKGQEQTLVLRKILVNIRKLLTHLNTINQYFRGEVKGRSRLDHSHFISHQSLDPKTFWNNLSLESSVFRHALRVCIASIAGFIIVNLLSYGHHSYWVLMTIAFMLKPAFSLTKQRNIERIVGTLAGGVIGVAILLLTPNKTVHFAFMLLFMIGTYSFMRIQYLIMVICTTPYVLILFSFLGGNFRIVAQERIFDTVLGCAIALVASYFLFPQWESAQLTKHLQGMLKANAGYLQRVLEALAGRKPDMLQYKLARKEVYLNSANLSAAFQRMLSEPKNKQKAEKEIHQFVVFNHILFSNIATVATTLLANEERVYPAELLHTAKRAFNILCESNKKFGGEDFPKPPVPPATVSHQPVVTADDTLMKEQIDFIYKVSVDIDKTTKAITG